MSHSISGFGNSDFTLTTFILAIKSGVKYLEIDIRASIDGILYLYHNPCTGKDTSEKIYFSTTTSEHINKLSYKNGEKILTLEEALRVFKSNKYYNQILCIDIKDFGYEIDLINLINKYELEDRIVLVSWIPQTILGLKQLGAKTPFILSHYNFTDCLWGIGDVITKFFKNYKSKFFRFVIIGKNKCSDTLVGIDKGYQHCLFAQEIPKELETILSSSGGGVCVPKIMIGNKLLDYCNKRKLKVWIFSVNSIKEFKKYSSDPRINVVFCNLKSVQGTVVTSVKSGN